MRYTRDDEFPLVRPQVGHIILVIKLLAH
jgi:hypothetical protein